MRNEVLSNDVVYVSSTPEKGGYGVFAKRRIGAGEVLETCPVILMPQRRKKYLQLTELKDYFFNWGLEQPPQQVAVVLGWGSLFNHSFTPNAQYVADYEANLMLFVALEDIMPDVEILVNYNGQPDDKTPVWFDVK